MEIIKRENLDSAPAASTTSPKIRVRELPSKFLPYPKGVEIYYYPYSIGELEDCHQILEAEDATKLAETFQGIECVGITVDKLDYQDLIYIMVLRKLSTFNENKFNFDFTCPHCKEDVSTVQNLEHLEFNDLPEIIKHLPITIKLKDGENAGKELVLNTVTAGKFIEYANLKLPTTDSSYIGMLVQNHSLEDAVAIIKTATSSDFEVLMALREVLDFDEQSILVKCPKCESDGKVNVEVLSQLATPFRRDAVSILSQIYSGT